MGRLTGRVAAVLLALTFLAPVLSLGWEALRGTGELWPHLVAYVLPAAVRTTGLLLAGVGLLVIVIGTGAAWLVTAWDFPGRRFLEAALLLPLAMPTYIIAYAWLDLLHPIGPLQTMLRAAFGIAGKTALLPDPRSLLGCIILLGLVLYPYVYLPVRALFLMQAGALVDAGRVLGAGPLRVFTRIALPLARPAIALGVGLALMETLNDVGAAEFLGVRTLTVQVYSTWVNQSDLSGAAQLSLVLLTGILLLVGFERLARGARTYAGPARRAAPMSPRRLRGWRAILATTALSLPPLLGFVMPAGYILHAATDVVRRTGWPAMLTTEASATFTFAAAATLICGVTAVLVATAPAALGRLGRMLVACVRIGYAFPGTVLVIGLLAPLALLDDTLARALRPLFGVPPAIIGIGTASALVLVYCMRFLTVAVGTTEAGLARIPASIPRAARTLGLSRLRTLMGVEIPLAWPALASGCLLVFVDCAKELPATLLLRPLNVETLATHLYGEAARGTYENGAVAALLIVAVGLLPVVLLLRTSPGRTTTVAPVDASYKAVRIAP